MEYISSTAKSLNLVPYMIIILSIISLICLSQFKNNKKNSA
jgi:hypothetical protein